MTPEELQTKCEQISHFIHYELPNWIDSAVFTQNSFKDLGELYYQHILSRSGITYAPHTNSPFRSCCSRMICTASIISCISSLYLN